VDLNLAQIKEVLNLLTDEEKAEIDELITSDGRLWSPLPGPQLQAWNSEADITFYGGAAGGGKSDLVIGLALEKHRRSIVYRREGTELEGIFDRITELVGDRKGFNGQSKIWRFPERQIEFGSCPHAGDERKYQGRPHDLKAFDEITNFLESQFRFLLGWLRSVDPSVKQRVVCTGNPPTSDEGAWVKEFWGAWLDPLNPMFGKVEPGELLWYTTIEGKDQLCDGPDPILVDGEEVTPMSRTFIPAKVEDNPYLVETGYKSKLQALPEPLRSQMLNGDFTAGTEDHEYQVIPTAWIVAAMDRWKEREKKGEMMAIGADIARGGADDTVLMCRHEGNWFDWPDRIPGSQTPDGPSCAASIIKRRRDMAPINIDAIGVGCSPVDFLKENKAQINPIDARKTTKGVDKVAGVGFANLKTELVWRFREGLDPQNPDPWYLPPDQKLRSELTMFRFKMTSRGYAIETKDDIKKRLGHSPDTAEAALYAAVETPKDGWRDKYRTETSGGSEQWDPYDQHKNNFVSSEWDPYK